jgi:cytoskeletal protein CcmA (bactofilin family)
MRRLWLSLFLLLWITGTVHAREVAQGDLCVIPAEQTVNGNLYVVCRELRIEGHITGSVIGAATNATISGTVEGDIFMAAGQLDLQGSLGEDVHFAGVVLRVLRGVRFENPNADLVSLTITTILAPDTTLPGSITAAGYQLLLNGTVNGEVSFWGSGLELDGRINGSVDTTVGDESSDGLSRFPTFVIPFQFDLELFKPGLRISEDAHIGGYLHYTAPTEAAIPEALAAQTEFTPTEVRAEFAPVTMEDASLARNVNLYFSQVVQEFATLGLIGVIVLLLFPRVLIEPLRYLQSRPLTCLGASVFTLIVLIPIGLAVFTLSIFIVFALSLLRLDDLVLALGALLGIINVGGVSLFAFIFGFLSRVIVCFAFGRMVLHLAARYTHNAQGQFFSLLIGVAAIALLVSLPLVGLLVYGIAAALGLGALLSVLEAQFRAARDSGLPNLPEDVPPPLLESVPPAPGMDNLPPGFVMWDD